MSNTLPEQCNLREINEAIAILKKLKAGSSSCSEFENQQGETGGEPRSSVEGRSSNFLGNLITTAGIGILMAIIVFITTQFILAKIQPYLANKSEVAQLNDRTFPEEEEQPKASREYKIYTIKAGETLSAIALKYNVSREELWETNQAIIPNPDKLEPGQKLIIPSE
uniref:LysM domain-containing protein n=1 Tax=Candidatus Kentrum eta TaxID=2126337 RepID=A0A450U914_9GAMM|nr:MAG: LysM domain-containing protein [Candidatus Kentron sp. H]VFJ92807.1 MAG: LysM domain-containing protein [Candidatus Kentron sp. H]VFJ94770.1 MAG: LysM domain-containing protein [Candidatus Kentron sp. H]